MQTRHLKAKLDTLQVQLARKERALKSPFIDWYMRSVTNSQIKLIKSQIEVITNKINNNHGK